MSKLIENIKTLREISGAGFLDCQKALKQNDHNLEKSIDFLRKKGLVEASKKSTRETNEGAVGVFVNEKKAVLIEINTETDFVAKNEIFLNFFEQIGNYVLNLNNYSEISINELMNKSFEDRLISEYFTEIISKIGENIILKKINITKNDSNTKFFTYTHNSYRNNIGKICVVLKAKVNSNEEEITKFGKNLCMHIAASKPLALNIENLDKGLIEKEKEIQLAKIKSYGKPEKIIDKILDGKMNKFYSEVILLNQTYVLDNENTVKSVIEKFSSKINFKIINYSFFVLGN